MWVPVRSLSWEDPLEEGMATHSSILAWRIPMDRGAQWATVRGVTESWTRLKELSTHGLCLSYLQICFIQGTQVPFPAPLGGLPSNPYLWLGLCWAQALVWERGTLGHPPEGLEQARAALWSSRSSLRLWPAMEERSVTSPTGPVLETPPAPHLVVPSLAPGSSDFPRNPCLPHGGGPGCRLHCPTASAVPEVEASSHTPQWCFLTSEQRLLDRFNPQVASSSQLLSDPHRATSFSTPSHKAAGPRPPDSPRATASPHTRAPRCGGG